MNKYECLDVRMFQYSSLQYSSIFIKSIYLIDLNFIFLYYNKNHTVATTLRFTKCTKCIMKWDDSFASRFPRPRILSSETNWLIAFYYAGGRLVRTSFRLGVIT